ncbi:MAG TPA: family 1 encapsulin nanocompartment shell protein [Streptosporangiaceae bacterium]|nr:family 1 encapsulin nanocompartment shell protein [Streptosporangiaceae bacterium]
MNNLHRGLAPVSDVAWESIEEEARRTFTLHLAGRRVVDLAEPAGPSLAAVGTGHFALADSPAEGVHARVRQVQPLVELRVPFTLDRQAIDDVERGAKDPDWQPVKDAAKKIAFAEDRSVFEGYDAVGVTGVRASSSNPSLVLPGDPRDYPDAVSQAMSSLRLAGVGGPYSLLLSAAAYTNVNETSVHGYPLRDHLAHLVDGDIIWAPAIDSAFLVSVRGGDYALHLGQDLSIGYLSHDADEVRLYFMESFTFLVHTAEAAVALTPAPV